LTFDLNALFLVANVLIAVAYLGLGIWVTPRFMIGIEAAPGSTAPPVERLTALMRTSALVFFVLNAGTHLLLAYWTIVAAPEWHTHWYAIAIHVVQAPAGLLFLALATRFFQIRVVSVLAGGPSRPPANLWARWWPRVRDLALFGGGLRGVIDQAGRPRTEISVELLMTFAAMMGLPLVLRGATKPTPLSAPVHAIDPVSKARVEIAPLNNAHAPEHSGYYGTRIKGQP
jgi:hypothetical protein